jgi:hypothetical protein
MYNVRDGYPGGAVTAVDDNNGNNPGNQDVDGDYYEIEFDQNQDNNAQNAAGTNRIDEDTQNNVNFAQHETMAAFDACDNRARNEGLYVADQDLNRNSARSTRQNPNGNRNGLECPEERDYYPYWHPTPWNDVAVLTSNTTWCQYYEEQSQNVRAVGYCYPYGENGVTNGNGDTPITEDTCTAAGGQWNIREATTGQPPACMLHAFSSDNHLGNSAPVSPEGDATNFDPIANAALKSASYTWEMPALPADVVGDEMYCTLRLRYNMSTNDYPSMNGFAANDGPMVSAADDCDDDGNQAQNAAEQLAAYNNCVAGCVAEATNSNRNGVLNAARQGVGGNANTIDYQQAVRENLAAARSAASDTDPVQNSGASGQSRYGDTFKNANNLANDAAVRDLDFDPINNPQAICDCQLSLCAQGELGEARPLYNRPYVSIMNAGDVDPETGQAVGPGAADTAAGGATDGAADGADGMALSIASNTDQVGRTFQDRSFVFKVQRRPANIAPATRIQNLGVRGRRGNIVQSYPSVEYDFVPNDQVLNADDYVHWQWSGSDYNVNRNANNAEGWRYSDRFNVVEFQDDDNSQFPYDMANTGIFGDKELGFMAATQSQEVPGKGYAGGTQLANTAQGTNQAPNNAGNDVTGCVAYEANDPNQDEEQNSINNCGKLNAAKAHFSSLHPAPDAGRTYHFGSTRNNNFSNRSQKSKMRVQTSFQAAMAGTNPGVVVAIVFGVLFGLALIVGVAVYLKKKKDGKVGIGNPFAKKPGYGNAPPPAAPPSFGSM